jgi:WD40 repeat protein
MEPVATRDGPNEYTYSSQWSPIDDYILSGSVRELRLLHFDRAAGTLEQVADYTDQAQGIYVAWSHDGRFALSVSTDVRLLAISRDPPAITQLARYTGHRGDIYAVHWSPDGHHALTTSKDSTLRLLAVDGDAARLEQRAVYWGHAGKVLGVAWSADGKNALSIGEDGTVRLLSVDPEAGGLVLLSKVWNDDQESAVSWPAPGRPVLTGTWGVRNVVQVWTIDPDRGTLTLQGEMTSHPSGLDVLEWSRDGQRLATAGHDDTLRLFAIQSDGVRQFAMLAGHTTGVHDVSWSPDDSYVALTSSHGDRVSILDMHGCDVPAN